MSLEAKLISLRQLRQPWQTTVLCHGCFDLFHFGHVRHLQEARALGDTLVVLVTADRYVGKGPGRPAFPAERRAEVLEAMACVDHVFVNEWDTGVRAIELLEPQFFVKGEEAKTNPTPGMLAELAAITRCGGQIHYTEGVHSSSTGLAKKVLEYYG